MISRILTILAAALAVTACQTLDPYSGEERTSRATIGAGIGAVIGAVAGAATGDDARERRQRALIGAGIGALSGAAVGNYMDNKAERLRQELAGTGVSVTRDGDNIILNMPGNITFQTDSAALQPQFFGVLDSVGTVLHEFDQTIIEVAGHTDSTGARSYNQTLSEQRASTVATYLHNRSISADRFLTIGYGQDRPIADNGTVDGRQANRHVEITLIPITQG